MYHKKSSNGYHIPTWLARTMRPYRTRSRARHPQSGFPRSTSKNAGKPYWLRGKYRAHDSGKKSLFSFSSLLSNGFHGSIAKFKKQRAENIHQKKVGKAVVRSKRRQLFHNLKTFFKR